MGFEHPKGVIFVVGLKFDTMKTAKILRFVSADESWKWLFCSLQKKVLYLQIR